jgi:hypothetical protein
LTKVEKVKAIVQSLHASEYVNSNGQPKKFAIVNLSPITLEEGQEATALFHLSDLVKCNWEVDDIHQATAGGGRGATVSIKEEKVGQDNQTTAGGGIGGCSVSFKEEKAGQEEDTEGIKTIGLAVGKTKKGK